MTCSMVYRIGSNACVRPEFVGVIGVEAVACGKLDGGRQDAPHFQGEAPWMNGGAWSLLGGGMRSMERTNGYGGWICSQISRSQRVLILEGG